MLDGARDGEGNMRRDRELFEALENRATDGASDDTAGGSRESPVLRLYTWSPWTVSLGQGQAPERALDLDALAARGYGWVKRPTGGRAVFHAEEITYAVVAPLTGPFAGPLAETHRRIGLALRRFYRGLGLAAELTRPAPAGDLDPREKAPCFVAAGLAEIELDGRKLAGSAQRRGRRAFLQHGSLLLGPAHLELAELLPLAGAERRAEAKRRLAARSASLAELLAAPPSPDEARAALVAAFAAEFAVDDWLEG